MKKEAFDSESNMRYLQLLAQSFPTIASASTEIINLQAILNLPKGTEHFLADIHGEYEAFRHILKNASGNIKRKVNELFGTTLRDSEKRELCTLIYYPEQKLELVKEKETELDDWYHITIHQLVSVCKSVSSKYTRSKVRKSLPVDFAYIIQELLHERTDDGNKVDYVNVIIETIMSTGRADDFIIAICNVIQRLAIDHLHILGDIFDRGPGAHQILDLMQDYHHWDIQWGNHDILWMGAAAGNDACICNVIRLSLRYANLTTLEEGYGINLMPLATFAMEVYKNDTCEGFMPKLGTTKANMDEKSQRLTGLMHKAIAIIQFKLEAQLCKKYPHWNMESRDLLSAVDYEAQTITIDGKVYPLINGYFPTVNPQNPTELTKEEAELVRKLHHSFLVSEKLQRHIKLLLQHGCMYNICNNNLMFHASVPLDAKGKLKEVEVEPGKKYKGRELLHHLGMNVRAAYNKDVQLADRQFAIDYFLYLWCGPLSPLFDKSKMATFERYFLSEKSTHKEEKGHYFKMRDSEEVADRIMTAFGLNPETGHIINGHVPVHVVNGENPIKAGGKLLVIDGGFSEPYHKETGIAGYTLIYHSRGLQLVQHEPFTNMMEAVRTGSDIKSTTQLVEMRTQRVHVADTDKGMELKQQIADLEDLLYAYRNGWVNEDDTRKRR